MGDYWVIIHADNSGEKRWQAVDGKKPLETEKPHFYWGFRGFLWWRRQRVFIDSSLFYIVQNVNIFSNIPIYQKFSAVCSRELAQTYKAEQAPQLLHPLQVRREPHVVQVSRNSPVRKAIGSSKSDPSAG